MLFDFEVRACTRVCAASGKPLQPGDIYFSVLTVETAQTVRHDFAADAWQGPPEGNLGWWRSRVPTKDTKPKLAPAEVMLNLFVSLADQPQESQFRYVLGLLLIRRKGLRREESFVDEAEQEIITVSVPKSDDQYELLVDEPDNEQAQQIQQRMIDLLYGDGEIPTTDTSSSNVGDEAA